METLFAQALGLAPPWQVASFDFRPDEGAIVFRVECVAKRLPCPVCGAAEQPIHDRQPRRWQHLHFFQYRGWIEASVPRVACTQCGKTRPQARISFDPFHVTALASQALDQDRRAETKPEPGLKGSRWALLKHHSRWSRDQIYTMHWLQRSRLKTARAWRLKEAPHAIYRARPNPNQAEALLRRWISWARRCRLAPFKRLGVTVRNHLTGIVEHFRSGLSNGFIEAMNAQIQASKARARGYATTRNMTLIACLLCAKLQHLPRNPWLHPAVT